MFLFGGVGAVRFDRNGNVRSAYRICSGTSLNCAGGKTPWGTWLTCEEHMTGNVFECDPSGARGQIRRAALGNFNHEAAAVDPDTSYVYLTEDETDGRFYRFRPNRAQDLSAGTLEVAQVTASGAVIWHVVPRPNPWIPLLDATRRQVAVSTPFSGGEGIVYSQGIVYFTTKGDNKVWEYDPHASHLSVFYDANLDPGRQLRYV